MVELNKLNPIDKAHWELHLKCAQKDLKEKVTASKEIVDFLSSKVALPDLEHPSYIHDWLEHPEMRLEAFNG